MNTLIRAYRQRFPKTTHMSRLKLWETVNRVYVQRFIKHSDVVLDIGAGYCEFINTIHCKKKIAVDLNPDCKIYARKDVEVLSCDAKRIPHLLDGRVDVVWMSNVLEHLKTKDDVLMVLRRVHKIVKHGGILIMLQPNIDLVKEKYWNFIDHRVALNGPSIIESLEISGFYPYLYTKRFLPYTTKGALPVWPWLIPLYFAIPSEVRPFAGQSFFIASKK